jgi:hypothetical protein
MEAGVESRDDLGGVLAHLRVLDEHVDEPLLARALDEQPDFDRLIGEQRVGR